jgi:D-3-phosphoglycerate dehydrogenase
MPSRVFISTTPFAAKNALPRELLAHANLEYNSNQLGRKVTEEELIALLPGHDMLIAGTETISERVMAAAPELRLISRVGIGLDGVDLNAARRRGIQVSYTPEAPAPAVAELTIGLMLSLLRSIHVANTQMHRGHWERHFGRRIAEVTIGVIGVGRIGGRVLRRISAFGTPRVLVNDLKPDLKLVPELKLEWVGKDEIYRSSDIVSIHVPLTTRTHNMIGHSEIAAMKPGAMIVNTARGGIVNEVDLAAALRDGHLGGAAIDVFEREPYSGELAGIERCLLTAHMGSMSEDCRARMEIEATEEVVRMAQGIPLRNLVPDAEFELQADHGGKRHGH